MVLLSFRLLRKLRLSDVKGPLSSPEPPSAGWFGFEFGGNDEAMAARSYRDEMDGFR